MESEKKRDSKQAIYNILSQLFLNGTNFLLIMSFSRFLSTDHYGIVSIYQAYVLFVAVIVGLRTQGSIAPAFTHIDKKEHKDYLASIMMLSIISFVVLFICTIFFLKPISTFTELDNSLIILMIFHCFGIFGFNFISIKFVFERKAQYSFLISLVMSVMMVAISYYSIYQDRFEIPDYLGRILGIAVPYVLCGIFSVIFIISNGNPFRQFHKYIKYCLPISLPLIVHGVSQIFLGQTNKVMLQKIGGDLGVVGIYSLIVTFVHILNALYTALNNTWVPIYYDYTKHGRTTEIKVRARNYSLFFSGIIVIFVMVSPEMIYILADSRYWNGISVIPIEVMTSFFLFMYSFAVNYEIYRGKTKMIAIGTLSAAIINIVLNWFLVPRYSMYGAAIATSISYLALYLFHEFYAKRIENSEYQFSTSFFFTAFVLVLSACIVFPFTINLWPIRWIIAILMGSFMLLKLKRNKVIF